MDIVTVVNRTSEPVEWMYDGRVHGPIPPLESRSFERAAAQHGRRKTRYGFDPHTGHWHFRLGLKEDGDNCEPIEPDSPDAPTQWIDTMHRKDEMVDADGRPLRVKRFSNPDLAMSRPTDGGDS